MLNILRFSEVCQAFYISYDTVESSSIFVFISDGQDPLEFTLLENGLYFFDATNYLNSNKNSVS